MDILRTTEKMISEVQFVVRLESLRNLVILGRRYRHLSFNSLYSLHSQINHLTKPHDQFFVRVCGREVSRNEQWAVIWCQKGLDVASIKRKSEWERTAISCQKSWDVVANENSPDGLKFSVRVVLMWRWHEKWRMGHTERISHSPFGLKRRSSAAITLN